MNKKIGLVVMFRVDQGGGAPRVVVDLVKALNFLGYKVHFLSPWKLNHEKIRELYEEMNIEKEYYLDTFTAKFCIGRNISRKLMKKKFIEMAHTVDLIIDIDGGVLHNYLPENKKYIIWRLSAINPEKSNWEQKNWKRNAKETIRNIFSGDEDTPSKDQRLYAVDDWTRRSLIEKWQLNPEEIILYPAIKTDHFSPYKKKKNQIIVLGRIVPNRLIDNSIRIFARGTREHTFSLIIIGGMSGDSEDYITYLQSVAQEEGVSDKITFIKSPSFEVLKNTVEESKIIIDSQRDISLNMTNIESLAAGVVVLVHKNSGTFLEVLEKGKYGVGFETIEEGVEKLKKIIIALERSKIEKNKFIKRAEFFSEKKFKERLQIILNDNL